MSLCRVCNHHHEDGVKCTICGHIGKSKVFQFLKNNRPINQLRFVSFCVDVNDSPSKGNWSLARLVRERNFGKATIGLFDSHDHSTTCNHALTFVGDAPVAAARWSWSVDNGVEVAVIDKLSVIDIRRRRTYGTYILSNIIEDIKAKMVVEGRTLYALVANVAHDQVHPAWKLFVKFGFQPMGEPFAVPSSPHLHVKMVLLHS